jgi:FO synthase
MEERIDSLLAIRGLHEKYGHIQEVIVQNFRAKPDIPMAAHPELSLDDMLRTLALARLILGEKMNIQAPPNLSYGDFPRLLDAGINDWGGISPVTKDFINPEAAWPQITRLQSETEARGFALRERLAIYPEYLSRLEFLAPRVREQASQLAGPDGYTQ